jgi:predicted small lipoprotein YifL
LAFGAAAVLALSLAACGRQGPLELPPSNTPAPSANLTASQAPGAPATAGPQGMFGGSSSSGPPPNAVDANGRPIYQPPPSQKSFILDPILQ